ncbi:MAG: type I DNA topoisomerase [Gemmatimonadota bacterium]|jgi:DNA topoisomerase-1
MAKGTKGKRLVIVESPAKARTIARYLGGGYEVAASVGHVRDLPAKELGVDVEKGFEPKYVTIRGKGKILQELKKMAREAEGVVLATDPDREGEAIAYHVASQLGLDKSPERFQRVTFHEITREAVRNALDHPEALDMEKVEAQQARRILDRLVGYQVSPFLWKPIRPGLSAGRVQTVALRLICEREDEILAFTPAEYWSIVALLEKDDQGFEAKLHQMDGKAFTLSTEEAATGVLHDLQERPFVVTEVKRRERRKNPFPPFTTSTLQQAAAKRLRFSARRTMTTAQRLYEGVEMGSQGSTGLITYMRTDSTRVAASAVGQARDWIEKEMGRPFLASSPQLYGGRQQKGAQEAHEAIRPTDVHLHPGEAREFLGGDEADLYELIWLRFVASQMAPAVYDTTTVDFDLEGSSGRKYLFRATGSVVKFPGYTRLYQEAIESGDHKRLDDLVPLPRMEEGDLSRLKGLQPNQHFTQPPPRFSEASLVRELEKQGIGRPSTYAQIISTIQDRGYVELEKGRFFPTPLGDTVSKLLVRVFPDIFDVGFTSRMEGELDRVEEGEVRWRELLEDFYPPFQSQLERGKHQSEDIIKELLEAEGETCEVCGRPMLVRWNKFGRFLGCSGYPECQTTRPLDAPEVQERILGEDPESRLPVIARVGPYGPYVQLGNGNGDEKPKRVSLPKGMALDELSLTYAVLLLSLPRSLGKDPRTGKEVEVGIGRYGPFVRLGSTYRNLKSAAQLFDLELPEALVLLATKPGREVIKELGPHSDSGANIQILSGRYGPYVTDGSVNASIPKNMDPEQVDLDDALDLLEKARARKGKGRSRKRSGGSRGSGDGGRKPGGGKKKR